MRALDARAALLAAFLRRVRPFPRSPHAGIGHAPCGRHPRVGAAVSLGAQVAGRGAGAVEVRRRLRVHADAADAQFEARSEVKTCPKGRSGPLGEAPPRARAAAALPGEDHAAAVPELVLCVQTPKVVAPANGVAGADVVGALRTSEATVATTGRVPTPPLVPAAGEVPLSAATREAAGRVEVRVRPGRRLPLPHPAHPAGQRARIPHAHVPQDARHALAPPLPHGVVKPVVLGLAMGAQHAPRAVHLAF